MISLLAASGMRIGEAIELTRHDVDLGAGVLTVVRGKYGIPARPGASQHRAMLRRYAARRDRLCPAPATDRFFLTSAGTPLGGPAWTDLHPAAGPGGQITAPPGQRRPRIHDLRHAFTVATLRDWYRDGVDVQARLPVLSAMLGHVAPAATYWYLPATPDLLALAAHVCRTPGRAAVTAIAPTLQAFFTERLITQRRASPHTIAAYRDTIRLLLDTPSSAPARTPPTWTSPTWTPR